MHQQRFVWCETQKGVTLNLICASYCRLVCGTTWWKQVAVSIDPFGARDNLPNERRVCIRKLRLRELATRLVRDRVNFFFVFGARQEDVHPISFRLQLQQCTDDAKLNGNNEEKSRRNKRRESIGKRTCSQSTCVGLALFSTSSSSSGRVYTLRTRVVHLFAPSCCVGE